MTFTFASFTFVGVIYIIYKFILKLTRCKRIPILPVTEEEDIESNELDAPCVLFQVNAEFVNSIQYAITEKIHEYNYVSDNNVIIHTAKIVEQESFDVQPIITTIQV